MSMEWWDLRRLYETVYQVQEQDAITHGLAEHEADYGAREITRSSIEKIANNKATI